MKKQAAQASRSADQAAPRTKRRPRTDKKVAKDVELNTGRNTPGLKERSQGPSLLERAQKNLNEAAEKLKAKIPLDMVLKEEQLNMESVQGCVDVNCIAEYMGVAIESLLSERSQDEESEKGIVKQFVKRLVKKTLPLVEQGLDAVQVLGGFLTVPDCRERYFHHTG